MASTATAVVPIIAVNNIPIDELQEQPVSTLIPDFKTSLIEQQQFSCTQCGKALRDPHTLKCHIKTVHGEKKFSCDKCDRRFPHKGALNAHKKTHESASFTCDICKETIKDSSYFKKHVRAHTAPRPHQCNLCGKSYLQRSHLTTHMSIHSDEKPFKCQVCSKSFRLAKAFREHKNMHENNKTFKCPHCAYTSCFMKNMQVHVRNHLHKQNNKITESKETEIKKCKADITDENIKEPKTSEQMISKETLSSSTSGHQDSSTSGRKDSCTSGQQDSCTSGRQDSCTSGHQFSSTSGHQDSLGEMESPVYLLVNLEPDENLGTTIHEMETLNPLEMAQELCITTHHPEKMTGDEYRPLDLSIVREVIFCDDDNESRNTTQFHHQNRSSSFERLTLDANYASNTTEGDRESPADMTTEEYLSYQAENPGRRRSVFLAEQLDYEHQGEMRVVDPTQVTG